MPLRSGAVLQKDPGMTRLTSPARATSLAANLATQNFCLPGSKLLTSDKVRSKIKYKPKNGDMAMRLLELSDPNGLPLSERSSIRENTILNNNTTRGPDALSADDAPVLELNYSLEQPELTTALEQTLHSTKLYSLDTFSCEYAYSSVQHISRAEDDRHSSWHDSDQHQRARDSTTEHTYATSNYA